MKEKLWLQDGYKVIRFTDDEINNNFDRVREKIENMKWNVALKI
jgi:very-short-patch-repair endonuclease